MLVSQSTISQRKPQLTLSANNADNKHLHFFRQSARLTVQLITFPPSYSILSTHDKSGVVWSSDF